MNYLKGEKVKNGKREEGEIKKRRAHVRRFCASAVQQTASSQHVLPCRASAFDRLMAKHVANVENCYAAFYQEEGGSPEIGVYALRFKKP